MVYFTKLRLSSHELLAERDWWIKSKVPYNESRCTFCNYPDIQNEFHSTLCCAKFISLRVKYINSYDYRRTNMFKFVELMKTENRCELHRHIVFLKLTFK